jgi:hypothetical protein
MLSSIGDCHKAHAAGHKAALLVSILVLVSVGAAQVVSAREEQSPTPRSSSVQAPSKFPENAGPSDSERMFGVVRTFGITNDKNAPPLSSRGKFRIFTANVTDPFTFVGIGIQAGMGQARNDFPSYGQGMSGYAKRFGASYADYAIGEFMSTYAFPSLLHEDPRYFREGEGSTKKRLGHAIASAFVTRKDSGRTSFNYSNSVGRVAAGAFSTLYYPEENRGVGLVFSRAGIGLVFGTAGAIFSEFGPDLQRKLFKRKSQKQNQDVQPQ